MPRKVDLSGISGLMGDQLEKLVKRTTKQLQDELKTRRPPIGTPEVSGVLAGSWQISFDSKYVGRVFSNLDYAEAVTYGTPDSLPPSWQGDYAPGRTNKTTGTAAVRQGYPDLIAKDLEKYVRSEWRRIVAED
jgi:hypothetical protein|tara:strand:- start:168 stop:566 length:399 start_codon:yes stop_codon:yes gene_type:complete